MRFMHIKKLMENALSINIYMHFKFLAGRGVRSFQLEHCTETYGLPRPYLCGLAGASAALGLGCLSLLVSWTGV